MWIEKLMDGVVELETPVGPRYVRPNLAQRARLIWTFRHFISLPQQVLRPTERRLIDRLWQDNVAFLSEVGLQEKPVIGRIEGRALFQEAVPTRKQVSRPVLAIVAQSRSG